jgi:hypothetical protein
MRHTFSIRARDAAGNTSTASPVLDYPQEQVWNGTEWVSMENAMIWNGTDWVPYRATMDTAQVWTGTDWVPYVDQLS